LGEGLKYIGGQAVKTRLEAKVNPLPSVPTIERVLREAHLTRVKTETAKAQIWYPHLKPTKAHQLHQVDIVPHYLQGGERIACFNAIDVVSRYPSGLALPQHRAQDAVAFLGHMWLEMGIADYTQVDNEGCFSGGATHAHVLGQVVRLALSVGTELVFSPFYHPESNGHIERFHQDYNRHVWQETYLENLETVNKKGQHFFSLYRLRQDHSQLRQQSPSAVHRQTTARNLAADFTLPTKKLPLREGRIHFLRQVSPEGTVRVLNVNWLVPRFDAAKGVWVTLEFRTVGAMLSIFDVAPDALQRECLATYAFPLKEPVLPLVNSTAVLGATETEAAAKTTNEQPPKTAASAMTAGSQQTNGQPAFLIETQAAPLPPLKLLPVNENLIRRSGRMALATLQHTARLTRQILSTMY
jgi:transposase InsO family protein